MAKEWIANLAQDIKQKNHEAADDYGRQQLNDGSGNPERERHGTLDSFCLAC